MLPGFKQWLEELLSKDSPSSAGDLDDSQSNSDRAFGRSGAKSKNFAPGKPENITIRNPEKMFGKKEKS